MKREIELFKDEPILYSILALALLLVAFLGMKYLRPHPSEPSAKVIVKCSDNTGKTWTADDGNCHFAIESTSGSPLVDPLPPLDEVGQHSLDSLAKRKGLKYMISCYQNGCFGYLWPKDDDMIFPRHQTVVKAESADKVLGKLLTAVQLPLPATKDGFISTRVGGAE